MAFAPDGATGNGDDESQRWEGKGVKIWMPSMVGYGFFLEWPIVADVTDLPTFMILPRQFFSLFSCNKNPNLTVVSASWVFFSF